MKLADITTVYRCKLLAETYHGWLSPNTKVLDIGCGTGVVADELRKNFGIQVEGCDVDSYLIRKIPFKKMLSPIKLPYKNKQFDITMFNDVLHHTEFDNQEILIKEALRTSKAVLLFELVPTFTGGVADYLINKIHNPKMNIPFTYRSPAKWKKIFRKLNLKYYTVYSRKPFWYPFTHIGFKLTH